MLSLKERQWKEFFIDDIFSIYSGKRLTKKDMDNGTIPFIGAADSGNGITNFISNKNESLDKNVLGVNYDGNGGMAISFYHPYECLFSDSVKRFHLKHCEDNKYVLLFLKTVILQQRSKYNYGYKFNERRMKRQYIMLPINKNGKPDYTFMEEFGMQYEDELKKKYLKFLDEKIQTIEIKEIPSLDQKKWRSFFIGGDEGIFKIAATLSGIDKNKLQDKDEMKNIPYVTRTDIQNGINFFIGNNQGKYTTNCGNVITIGLDTQTVFYQPFMFYTGQNIQVLSNDNINKYNALFIIPLLKNQMVKFNWGGNGATLGRLNRTKILLPVNDQGKPDYEYMEQYIKNLMKEQYTEYVSC